MKGVQFVVDECGTKTAVVISLKHHAELWEDVYGSAIAEDRKNEPREALESVKEKLIARRTTRSHR